MNPIEDQVDLKKIFDSFDLDKSGSIDLKQIGNVAAKLGKQLSPEQLTKIVKQLDTNKDGKITYGEFEYWWVKGMQGRMAQLVYLKAKAMKMKNFVQKKFTDANISFEGHKGNPKPDKYSIKLQFGTPASQAIKVDFGLYLKGEKQVQLRKKVKGLIPDVDNSTIGIFMKLPSKNPAEAKVALDHALNSLFSLLPMKIQSIQQNPFIKIKTTVGEKQLFVQIRLQNQSESIVTPMATEAEGIAKQIGEGFYTFIEANLSINSTFDTIVSDQVIDSILRGFSFGLQIQSNNSALSKLRKLAQKQQLQLPVFGNLVTLFRNLKFHLKIKSPEHLQSFFKKLGIKNIISGLPTLKDLLEQMSPEVKKSLGTDPLVDAIHKASQFAFKHIQNDVQIFILGGNLASGFLRLQGKNISKIHCILFNES